ncbi:Neurogenic locus notch -like protein 2 [Trichinella pseudospiralis]|uniref:Neurogenic locus notch-like protein 2 n=1 Tax=Trichinella pseudospiralis TaxID=6337 RepID=A0A0V0XJS3_TRIPS|nr:Neurogenic locus notch -like protein 2 [Trichinella pseudospiralis]KRY79499.1 Neurogenic locus notch -like protein 2 [Trichinella pseudospiralis]KRZ44168.1 Neurogenic locus notch -like protein 2 [Trichinella pseudospiralis]
MKMVHTSRIVLTVSIALFFASSILSDQELFKWCHTFGGVSPSDAYQKESGEIICLYRLKVEYKNNDWWESAAWDCYNMHQSSSLYDFESIEIYESAFIINFNNKLTTVKKEAVVGPKLYTNIQVNKASSVGYNYIVSLLMVSPGRKVEMCSFAKDVQESWIKLNGSCVTSNLLLQETLKVQSVNDSLCEYFFYDNIDSSKLKMDDVYFWPAKCNEEVTMSYDIYAICQVPSAKDLCKHSLLGNDTCRECVGNRRGPYCEIMSDDCISELCPNAKSCVLKVGAEGVTWREPFPRWDCICREQYTGRLCDQRIDESDSQVAGYYFGGRCRMGFTGRFCETLIDDCSEVTGTNILSCEYLELGAPYCFCLCKDGFAGPRCELIDNLCLRNPCKNAIKCEMGFKKYKCYCKAGFTGKHCEMNIDECESNPCLNRGTCVDGDDGYTCLCRRGFEGPRCAGKLSPCQDNPCRNGGRCREIPNGNLPYTCICSEGYYGDRCENAYISCHSESCMRPHGRCVELKGKPSYTCICSPGYGGDQCEGYASVCFAKCYHGKCIENILGFSCDCSPGFTGKNCLTELDECEAGLCKNGGICIDEVNSYRCVCHPPYTGENCEQLITTSMVVRTVLSTTTEAPKRPTVFAKKLLDIDQDTIYIAMIVALAALLFALLVSLFYILCGQLSEDSLSE